MPKETNKYNSACEAEIHTNQPHVFVLHVARCKTCQEKLPPEILESLEPNLSKNIANIVEREAEKGKQSPPVQPVKDRKDAPPQLNPPKLKESQLPPRKPDQPADDLDDRISKLPTIKRLSDSVEKLASAIGVMAGLGGVVAGDTGKEAGAKDEPAKAGGGEPVTDVPVQAVEVKQGPAPGAGGERVTVPEELLHEAQDIRKGQGGDSGPPLETGPATERLSMREGEDKPAPGQKEEPVIPPKQEPGQATSPDLASRFGDLPSAGQALLMEEYLRQQKQKLGMEEGPTAGPSGEKGVTSFLGGAKGLVAEVRGIIDAFKGTGGAEGSSGPMTKEKLADTILMKIVENASNKKDPIEYFLDGLKIANAGGGSKKDPMEYFSDGMKQGNAYLGNAIKIISGRGNIGGPTEDIETVVKRVVQKMITPAPTEHLSTGEEGK